jgi:hypothetical protein
MKAWSQDTISVHEASLYKIIQSTPAEKLIRKLHPSFWHNLQEMGGGGGGTWTGLIWLRISTGGRLL